MALTALQNLLSLFAAIASPPQPDCAGLTGAMGDVVVERAERVIPDPQWEPQATGGRAIPVTAPFCRVEGLIEGSIGFELWLPTQWNGRMLGAGVGGPAGFYNYRDMSIRMQQGFATVTMDSGHKLENVRWMREPKARADYEHRAVHLTAEGAKELIERFYGEAPARSYYLGCSGGGRQALKEMQNYPEDYDGVIAGAPGPNMPLQSVRMLWFALEQQRQPQGALREEDWSLYESSVVNSCDALDGVTDGIMENPAACQFQIESLICRPGQQDGCLSAPRAAMISAIVAPMVDEQGRAMDRGIFPGVRTRPGPPSPLLRALWSDAVYDDPDWDALTFHQNKDLDAVYNLMPELRADRTDISGFLSRGNKAILYQGWQDPSTNAGPTIDYYAQLAAANGGAQSLASSVRLFMVPGMYHCGGGTGADLFGGAGQAPASSEPGEDMLWALINWVERGQAPASLAATRREDGNPVFTRKLCPFPQSANFNGGQDSSGADNFTCRNDPLLEEMMSRSPLIIAPI